MNESKRACIQAAAQQLMAAHDSLLEQLPTTKRLNEADAVLSDALDSLEEAIDCLQQLLDA